jgi:hypothetical protein
MAAAAPLKRKKVTETMQAANPWAALQNVSDIAVRII